jgi:23S rRNA (uridine2552-2'-O)-methyltransferase
MSNRRSNPYVGDSRTKLAKAQGYPARSVFKLEEIDERLHLLAPGQRILDLGAAPGSWSAYAAKRVGPSGLVLAVDLKPIEGFVGANVKTMVGDALVLSGELLTYAPYDVVLSDMAPNTSGNRMRDQALSFELFSRALEVARGAGAPGGSFVGKLFMGPDFEAARAAVAESFETVRNVRPKGTRQNSVEVFLVGIGRREAT